MFGITLTIGHFSYLPNLTRTHAMAMWPCGCEHVVVLGRKGCAHMEQTASPGTDLMRRVQRIVPEADIEALVNFEEKLQVTHSDCAQVVVRGLLAGSWRAHHRNETPAGRTGDGESC